MGGGFQNLGVIVTVVTGTILTFALVILFPELLEIGITPDQPMGGLDDRLLVELATLLLLLFGVVGGGKLIFSGRRR